MATNEQDTARELLSRLLDWADHMGGWDAPIWAEAKRFMGREDDEPRRYSAATPPTYYACGICDHYHPADWNGDCREDAARFFVSELDEAHGALGWQEVDMPGTENEESPE